MFPHYYFQESGSELVRQDAYRQHLKQVEEQALRRAEIERVLGKPDEPHEGVSLGQLLQGALQSLFPRRTVAGH